MSEWSDQEVTRLRDLWHQKTIANTDTYSSEAIGRLLHRSKNAVVGKAHRLDLTARPSPIKTGVKPKSTSKSGVSHPLPPVVETLPPLVSLQSSRQSTPSLPVEDAASPSRQKIISDILSPAPPKPPAFSLYKKSGRLADGSGCCFPIGDPGTRSFRYCDNDIDAESRNYCADHHARCYVKVRNREKEPIE